MDLPQTNPKRSLSYTQCRKNLFNFFSFLSLLKKELSPISFLNCQGDKVILFIQGTSAFKFAISSSESLESSIKPETITDANILILNFNITLLVLLVMPD